MRLQGTVASDVEPGVYYVKYGIIVYPNAFWGDIWMWGVYMVHVYDPPLAGSVSKNVQVGDDLNLTVFDLDNPSQIPSANRSFSAPPLGGIIPGSALPGGA